ncbi:MAG: hypothetical protein M1833_002250 [Piccolia ochrophora]|nr:MAG: hypothetical protein M1833_002250 [Piccolia ochrophora]
MKTAAQMSLLTLSLSASAVAFPQIVPATEVKAEVGQPFNATARRADHEIDGLPMNVCGGYFYLGLEKPCTAAQHKSASFDTIVAGGQKIWVMADGALNYNYAHDVTPPACADLTAFYHIEGTESGNPGSFTYQADDNRNGLLA